MIIKLAKFIDKIATLQAQLDSANARIMHLEDSRKYFMDVAQRRLDTIGKYQAELTAALARAERAETTADGLLKELDRFKAYAEQHKQEAIDILREKRAAVRQLDFALVRAEQAEARAGLLAGALQNLRNCLEFDSPQSIRELADALRQAVDVRTIRQVKE